MVDPLSEAEKSKLTFKELGLSEPLLEAIADQQYARPYPIQQDAIPPILRGKDILGIAKTGSGKTASFVLPILELFHRTKNVSSRFASVLVLVPTRELAGQVADVFLTLGGHLFPKVKTVAVYGGVAINPQMQAVHGADIIVATPGRLLDLLAQNALRLSDVEILVLDEADKMLELGFADEMDQLFDLLPQKRQTILFSATLGDAIQHINTTLLRNPVKIEVVEETTNLELIEQLAYKVDPTRKGPLLRYLIKSEQMKQVLVFVSSTRTADNLVVKLNKNGIQAAAIHGQKGQQIRTEVLHQFKSGKLQVMVATDLLARGIDIQLLPYVINFDLPRSPKDYVHRIGRTGRAEATGKAFSLITPDDEHHFKIIQKKMGKRVEQVDTAELDLSGY
ncbi:DEAD/DEAH box helicase [Spirosoma sp. BT702]|uniref:DEAD/DEAH box helicase n=1 Tax=Spirosoma profusum TaxID=2771354 RepID=A0A927ARF1_9BACT|nr:DEAD/DEAH box helicase [Spirosoma profusum]MBD2702161.1 DEAD/DEAH box helicase [Spirosoma profusum]